MRARPFLLLLAIALTVLSDRAVSGVSDLLSIYSDTVIDYGHRQLWGVGLPTEVRLNPAFHLRDPRADPFPLTVKTRRLLGVGSTEWETWLYRQERIAGVSPWIAIAGVTLAPVGNSPHRSYAIPKEPTSTASNRPASHRALRLLKIRYPESLRAQIESGSFGSVQVKSTRARWDVIPKGTHYEHLPKTNATSGVLPTDVAVLSVTLEIEEVSRSREDSSFRPPFDFILVDQDDAIIASPISCGNCEERLRPKEIRQLELSVTADSYDTFREIGPMTIVSLHAGWRFKVPPLPPPSTK